MVSFKEYAMNKNTYTVLCMMLLSVVIAFSGTHYWDDGEIVRGPKINVALDEKLDQSGATFFSARTDFDLRDLWRRHRHCLHERFRGN